MGTFLEYTGNSHIKEKDRETFIEQMSKILNYGGMMMFSEVKMYEMEILLLQPVVIHPDKDVHFYFNYFEEDSWESAGFDTKDLRLWSGKVGSCEFYDVMYAAYSLYEAYDDEVGFVTEWSHSTRAPYPTGWLNHILGTDFSMKNRFRFWDFAEKTVLDDKERYDDCSFSDIDLHRYIPNGMDFYAGGTEFTDLMYILHGTDTLTGEEVEPGSYPEDVLFCKRALESYLSEENHSLETLLAFLKKQKAERQVAADVSPAMIALSLILPARVFLYLASEITKQNFWQIWMERKDEVYHDEEMKKYASDALENWRKEHREKPVGTVPTSQYLKQDGAFTFWHTPKEIKSNYYLSDDDRLYWWDGTDEVVISPKTEQWLLDLSKEYNKIKDSIPDGTVKNEFLKHLMELADEIDKRYGRVHFFAEMFYEFLQNSHKKEYLAATELIRFVADHPDNKKAGEIISHAKGKDWDLVSKNVKCNEGRMNVKRILSVMANKKLRKKYFGF